VLSGKHANGGDFLTVITHKAWSWLSDGNCQGKKCLLLTHIFGSTRTFVSRC